MLGMAKLACAITAVEKAARPRKVDECMLRDENVLGNKVHRQEERKEQKVEASVGSVGVSESDLRESDIEWGSEKM